MNTEELTELITYYLTNSKLSNAILIDGAWGSGKTYYVRNDLIDSIQRIQTGNNKRLVPVYISLYGLENLSDISKEMFNKTIYFGKDIERSFKSGKFIGGKGRKKYAWDVVKGTTKAMIKGVITKHLGIEFALPKIEDYLPYIDETEVVLILDDLERSRIDIVELLGFINSFVEEYAIKTIIVGNEKEIRKMFYQENLISKYELVKNLDMPIGKQDREPSFFISNGNKPKVPSSTENGVIATNIETLNAQVKYLFPNSNNYEIIKEKLIGFTVGFTPDLELIFNKLAGGKINKETINRIYSRFKQYKCSNIRTFLFALEMYDKICPVIKNAHLANIDDVIKYVTESIFELSISIKDNLSIKNLLLESYNFSFENSIASDISDVLKSEVSNFLNTSIIDKDKLSGIFIRVDKAITNHKSQIASKQTDTLNGLQHYWLDLEDSDLQLRMKKAIDDVCAGPVDISIYKKLINYIYFYNEIFHDNEINVKEVVDILVDNISKSPKHITEDDFLTLSVSFTDEAIVKEISNHYKRITDEKRKRNYQNVRQINEDDSISENWIEKQIELNESYRKDSKDEKMSIIGRLNIPSLLANIEKCSTKELNDFYHNFLEKIYIFSNIGDFYSNDLHAIEELRIGLINLREKNQKTDGKKTFNYVLSQIITYLDKDVKPRLESKSQ